MAKGIQLGRIRVFTDKGTGGIGDPFGNTDSNIWCLFKSFFKVTIKAFQFKGNLRNVDKERVVLFIFAGKSRGRSEPSGMTSHDFNDRYGALLVNRSVEDDLADRRCHIFSSASETRCMIGKHEVIVDGFRDPDEADTASGISCIA